MKNISLITILLFLLSLNTFAQTNNFKVLNIMDAFWKFWEKAEKADKKTKIKLYREMVIEPHKEIYSSFTGEQTDEDLGSYFDAVTRLIPQMKTITQKLSKELPENTTKFRQTFPDMNWQGTVVFFTNYGITDSGTGTINGKPYLIFGVDAIANIYGENADLSVLFSHELFHLYHSQFRTSSQEKLRDKEEIPLYSMVWGEGLAVYVSKKLNPKATAEQYLISKTLEKEASPILGKLAQKIIDNFDAKTKEVWEPFMSGNDKNKDIPGRSGYFVGYKIAEELGKKMSLQQLARLEGEDLRKKMMKALKKIAKAKNP